MNTKLTYKFWQQNNTFFNEIQNIKSNKYCDNIGYNNLKQEEKLDLIYKYIIINFHTSNNIELLKNKKQFLYDKIIEDYFIKKKLILILRMNYF